MSREAGGILITNLPLLERSQGQVCSIVSETSSRGADFGSEETKEDGIGSCPASEHRRSCGWEVTRACITLLSTRMPTEWQI